MQRNYRNQIKLKWKKAKDIRPAEEVEESRMGRKTITNYLPTTYYKLSLGVENFYFSMFLITEIKLSITS